MRINTNYGNYGIYSLYDTLYQNTMSVYNNKLTKQFFPANNKAQKSDPLSSDSMQYVTNIKSASKNLSGALNALSGGAAFAKKTMISSDTDTLSVNYTDNKISKPDVNTVNVKQTAAGQLNEGARLQSDAAFGSTGTNKFAIEIGGKKTDFSVNITAGDTNKDVQQKMADAVNKAGIGVKATVETDAKNNVSLLKIEATGVGDDAKNKFTVTDVIGNIAAKTGANDVSKQAQNAIYSVNDGPERTSKSNTVDLGSGLSVTFNKASDKAVTISQGIDTASAKSAVNDLVKSYNDLYTEALKNSNDPKAENLASKMLGISRIYSGSLASVGIGFDKDGKMTVDTAALDKAGENGNLKKFFTENSGKNYGFTNQLGRLADNVSRNTSNYVTKSSFGASLTENFAYSGFGDLISYNYLSSGWIFDYSF